MTPLIVIVGFLGAGKTTFLQNLVPALGAEGLSPSLLINDYQNARIDAERFRGVIDEVTALNGDCVCCGSRDELLAALEQFEHRTGRVLLLETNGTTDSEQLLETLAFNKDIKRFTPPIQLDHRRSALATPLLAQRPRTRASPHRDPSFHLAHRHHRARTPRVRAKIPRLLQYSCSRDRSGILRQRNRLAPRVTPQRKIPFPRPRNRAPPLRGRTPPSPCEAPLRLL